MSSALAFILEGRPACIDCREQDKGYVITVQLPPLLGWLLGIFPLLYLLIFLLGGLFEGWAYATRELILSDMGQFNTVGVGLAALLGLHLYFQRVIISVDQNGVCSRVRIPLRRARFWEWQEIQNIRSQEDKHYSSVQQTTYELQAVQLLGPGEVKLGTLITFMDKRAARWLTRLLKTYRQEVILSDR